jgi:hypothetical protein
MAFVRNILLAAFALMLGSAQAALHDRSGGLIYDDILNVTWLQDANFAAGSAYDDGFSSTDGQMTWASAMAWVADLSYAGFTDWRLPFATPVRPLDPRYANDGSEDYGFNITRTSSEMAHLYYVSLSGIGARSPSGEFQPGHGTSNSTFHRLAESAGYYWTETESYLSYGAYSFNFSGGSADANNKISEMYALAVRDGDVEANHVPEPETILLLGVALVTLLLSGHKSSEVQPTSIKSWLE